MTQGGSRLGAAARGGLSTERTAPIIQDAHAGAGRAELDSVASTAGDDLAFLAAGGEMGALVRAFDWGATPMGAIATWPQSLKTAVGNMLMSPVPMTLLWGAEGVMVYNDAYSAFAGQRHPQLLGTEVRQAWPEVADFNGNVMQVGLAGGTLAYRDQELILFRNGAPEQVWMNLYYSPVLNEAGRPAGVMAIVVETTGRVLADRAVARRDLRKAFLLDLLQGQRETTDPTAMMHAAAAAVGQHLEASRTGFFEVADGEMLIFGPCWTDGTLEPLSGEMPAARIGSGYLDQVHEGQALAIGDVRADPLTAQSGLARLGTVALIGAPIFRQGIWRAGFYVNGAKARKWRAAEVSLVSEVADQTWDAVERARMQAALRHSEEQLRLATEAAEVGLWDVDMVTDVLFWPPRVKAMFGISADVPVSMQDFYAGVHPDDLPATAEAFAAATDPARRTVYDVEYRTIGKEDGVVRWLAAKGRGVFDAHGRCVRAIGTAIDISRRKKTEEALRDLNETLERRVEARTAERDRVWRYSRDLLVIIGNDGILRAVNPAWTSILGYTPEEVIGHSYADFVVPEHADMTRRALTAAIEQQDLTDFEIRIRHKDGTERWVSWHTSREGDLAYGYGRDVTLAKEQAAALAKAEEALRQSQKMEAVGQLTGGIAHDFNNLLTGITGSLQMMQVRLAQGKNGELERYIASAQGSAKRAAALTHRLLAFSRRQTLEPRPTDVNRLIAGMEDLIRRSVGPGVHMEVVGAGGAWLTLVDPNQLENALLNLCINARDAMPEGGRLTIETANKWLDDRAARERDLPPGQYLALCVTDTGTGMTAEVLERAFDPFFTTKPFGEGTGLGLSMIYGFARQSGGQIRIYTELGSGTTMCLYLPRYDGDSEAETPSDTTMAAERHGEGETILVVDDEAIIRLLIREMLEDTGYTVLEAPEGDKALKLLQGTGKIDLLITDVGLPGGMNGRQVADAARALRPGLKVLFITGYAENAALGNGLLEKGMRVVTKPFDMEDLARKVRDLIES